VSDEARLDDLARAAWRRLSTDEGAAWTFRAALVLTVPVMYIVGRHQWFIRDDWAFIVTRNAIREQVGWQEWLFLPTIGHWMTVPLLIYRGIENTFGIDSYWPFLAVNMAIHIGIVLAVRRLCRRAGVQAWTTTLVCAGLLMFGAGWENIVFAVQITYGLSLLAFLVQLLLVDHEGPIDRRDIAAAALAIVGVMSSGFGPFFLVGMTFLLVARRRWRALAVAVGPQLLALAWWWLAWGSDSPEESAGGSIADVPAYAVNGVIATFQSLTGIAALGGIAAVAAFAVALWRGTGWRVQSLLLTLWLTAAAMYVGLGTQRVGLGVENAAISRYQYMGAMLLVPAFALAFDQLRTISVEASWVGRVVLVVAAVLSLGSLRTHAAAWAIRATDERHTLELIAGSGLVTQADPSHQPLPFSPDVRVSTIASLVDQGAITPRTPTTPEDLALVRAALGLAP
jgi:hypothetical protein